MGEARALSLRPHSLGKQQRHGPVSSPTNFGPTYKRRHSDSPRTRYANTAPLTP